MDDDIDIVKVVFTTVVIFFLVSSGVWYITSLFRPLDNQLKHKAIQSDPTVVQSRQEEIIKILNDIETSRSIGNTAQVIRGRTLLRQVSSSTPYLEPNVKAQVDKELAQ